MAIFNHKVEVQTLIKVAELLLGAGADMDARDHWGFTALVFAARDAEESHQDLLKFLIKKGADVNVKIKHGGGALSLAARCGKQGSVKILIEAGADVHETDNNGNTALISANGQRCSAEMVKLLLKAGIDPDARNNEGETALMKAAQHGNYEAVKTLIAKGVDVNQKDRYGRTALMRAAEDVNLKTVKALVEAKAAVDAKDCYGSGILAWVAKFDYGDMSPDSWNKWKKKRMDTVKYLVESKGVIDSKNQWGETALDLLEKGGGNRELVSYLKGRRDKAS